MMITHIIAIIANTNDNRNKNQTDLQISLNFDHVIHDPSYVEAVW